MPTSEIPLTETAQQLVALLQAATKPMTYGQLQKEARLKDAEMQTAIDAAEQQGAVFFWSKSGKSKYYWRESPKEAARQAVLAVAAEEALSESKLIEQARKRVRGLSKEIMQTAVKDLLSGKQLDKVPAFTAGKLLILPGDSAGYARSARKFVEAKFKKAGVDFKRFEAPKSTDTAQLKPGVPAPGPAQTASQILDAIRSLEPVPGVPVSAQRLRNHLPGLRKRDFDSAALELRKTEKVFLNLHHDPHNLPPEERDLLIDGGDGTYYVAIATRR